MHCKRRVFSSNCLAKIIQGVPAQPVPFFGRIRPLPGNPGLKFINYFEEKMIKMSKRPYWASKVLAGPLVLGLAISASAQPGGGGGNRPNFQNMTPEERQTWMAQAEQRRTEERQGWLRQAMLASGVTDTTAQSAVIDYIASVDQSKTTLREMARALSASLVKTNTTDAEISTSLTAYRAAVAAARTKQAADLAALNTTTKYSTSPRVEALLTLLGVLGPETSELGGIGEIFPDSPYGMRGGFGGGRGGQGGGRGGMGGGRRGGGQGGPGGGGPGGGGMGG